MILFLFDKSSAIGTLVLYIYMFARLRGFNYERAIYASRASRFSKKAIVTTALPRARISLSLFLSSIPVRERRKCNASNVYVCNMYMRSLAQKRYQQLRLIRSPDGPAESNYATWLERARIHTSEWCFRGENNVGKSLSYLYVSRIKRLYARLPCEAFNWN